MNMLEDRNITVTRIIKACRSQNPRDYNESYTHTRMYHGLILRLNGNTVYGFNERSYTSHPGDLIVIPKGIKYTLTERNGGDCLIVNFDTLGEYDREVVFLHPKNTSQYDELFRRAIRLEGETDICGEKSVLYELLSKTMKISEDIYGTAAMKKKLEPALRFFDSVFTDPCADISVEQLAKRCKMSETYFRKLFRAVYGMTPGKFFMTRRLDRAKAALNSGLRVCDAAAAAGFDDPSYFVKVFRRETGVTPGKYQREPV